MSSVCCTVEHSMSVMNNVYNFHTKMVTCNATITDKWKYYFINEQPHIFMVLPYHFLFTILIEVRRYGATVKRSLDYENYLFSSIRQWTIIAFTFGWNYMDTFIMLTSIGLATRFKQINQRLEEMKNEVRRKSEKYF